MQQKILHKNFNILLDKLFEDERRHREDFRIHWVLVGFG
jgi:hypothetical protein